MRLFVAITVPPALHPAISRASGPLRGCMGVRLLPPDNWHLTLCFIGDADEDKAKRITEALAAIRFSPFVVRLAGAGAYPSTRFPRAIFIGGESQGAEGLAAKVEAALLPFGIKLEKFSVHLTVARSKGAGDIEDFLKETGEVGEFEARSFCLMKSSLLPASPAAKGRNRAAARLPPQGAAYEVLKEYPAQESLG